MYPFEYQRPVSLQQARELFESTPDGQWLAGGMTLLPAMKLRLTAPSMLIDLVDIDGLEGIELRENRLVIGSITSHAAVARSSLVRERIPALAQLAGHIGDTQVRNRGTIGGSISNNDPAADYPAAVVGLNATVLTTTREIPADDFFCGLFETALEPGELITAVSFEIPERAAYVKFPNPASRYAVVGVLVSRSEQRVRVAVTGAGPCVFRAGDMELALENKFSPEVVSGIHFSADELNEDLHASAAYRAHLVNVLARRSISAALAG